MARPLRFAVLALAALLASACTLTQLVYSNVPMAYNNAAPMLSWMVSDYVEMSDDQKEFVRDRVSRAFAWHRAQQLPEYRGFFERVLVQAADNISVDEAAAAQRDLRDFYHRALERLLPDMAEFLLRLDSLQAKQMEQRFNKENRKMVGEANDGSPDERREKRAERFAMHLEQFTGPLNESQRALVAAYVAGQSELIDERLADRRYRQAGILRIVQSKPPRDDAVAELRRLLIATESWRNADYQRKLKARERQLSEFIAKLSASLAPEQREAFQRRVRGFMRDITEITASRASTAG
ncbi:MAG TPA: DUF6279 family lipoprotein [Usitatibacter sp.]|nr:DUF6279 family lipoprotein [Usitatibacter sp.]